jgi:hypothetical protein
MSIINEITMSSKLVCLAKMSALKLYVYVSSWAGLCPSVDQSGSSLYMGRMKDDNNNKEGYATKLKQLILHLEQTIG